MNARPRHPNGIALKSARELVALTVVTHRWQRDYLQALAHEQECTLSAVLRALLDQALGPGPEEAAPAKSDERSPDEPGEPAMGRSIWLEPRHREVLAAIADRRALSVSALLGAILDSWVEAHLQASD
jgi:predicted DNA-binding ribbon-helix-helix protein